MTSEKVGDGGVIGAIHSTEREDGAETNQDLWEIQNGFFYHLQLPKLLWLMFIWVSLSLTMCGPFWYNVAA